MKVAFLSPSYHPAIGGLETHLKHIAEKLAKQVNLEIYTYKNNFHVDDETEINGVRVRRFRTRRISYGIEIPSTELIDAVKNSDFDIIHLHSFHTLLPYFARRCLHNSNQKLIITPHYHGGAHTFIRNILFTFYKPILAKISQNADKIVCVSSYEKSLVMRDFRVDDDNVVVIPNGTDIKESENVSNVSKDIRKVLFVGRLEKYKNIDKLVQAMKVLKDDGFTLTIVGDGSARQELLKLIAKMDMEENVCIRSNLSREDLANEYTSSNIFVMPSSYEAYGIAVAEALSFGLKVIVSDTNALSEFVRAGYAQGVPLPVTSDKIVRAILSSSKSNSSPRKYSPHTWDFVAKELTQVYESVMN